MSDLWPRTLSDTPDTHLDDHEVLSDDHDAFQVQQWDAYIVKSSDQTVTNSAALTSNLDSELKYTPPSTGVYEVELVIIYSGNDTTGDYAWGVSLPTTTSSGAALEQHVGYTVGLSISLPSQPTQSLFCGTTGGLSGKMKIPNTGGTQGTDASDTKLIFFVKAFVTLDGSSTGDIQYMFANNMAASGRTSTTHAGSTMRVRKIV